MGIESRDYFRDASARQGGVSGGGGYWPPVCKWILLANIAAFLLQIFVSRPATFQDYEAFFLQFPPEEQPTPEEVARFLEDAPRISSFQEALELRTDAVFKGEVWRIVTTAFCHDRGSVLHILFNMLFLVWFGKTLERMYGSREFLAFYLVAAVLASVAYIGLELVTGDRIPAIGASGAVMGVVMLYAMHYPREEIRLWFLIPIQIRFIVLLYVIFDLHPVLLELAGEKSGDGIAHAAHLGGLAFGFLYYRRGWRLEGLFGKRGGAKKTKTRPKSKVRPQPKPKRSAASTAGSKKTDLLESKTDAILQKISEHGFDSLSEAERKFLDRVSEEYRRRK